MLAELVASKIQRSFENPATSLSDPAEWLKEAFGATTTDTGITIDWHSALGLPPLLRAVVLISTDVAKLPLITYKRLPGGGKERDPAHPAHFLLRRKPVPEMSAFVLKQCLMGHALLKGNGYAYIPRLVNGQAAELWLLNPNSTTPVYADRELRYLTYMDNQPYSFPARDVLHIKGLGFDGITGYSIITIARNAIGLGLALQKYRTKFFANNAQPSFALEHPGELGAEGAKNILDSLNAAHQGLDRVHRPIVLEEGMKLNPFSLSARDAQLAEALPFTARDVSCLTGVPAHKLGDPERSSYASLEQENQSYLNEALDGWLTSFEEECWDKLLTEEEKRGDTHIIEFLRAALLRADLNTRYTAYHTALLDGWMNRDEVRERENLNPLPDGAGQEFYEPANMLKAQASIRSVTPAQRALLSDALIRIVRRIATAAERKAKQGGWAFFEWLQNRLVKEHGHVSLEILTAPIRAIEESLPDDTPTLSRLGSAYETFWTALREHLLTATECSEEELIERVRQAMWTLEKDCEGRLLDAIAIGVSHANN